MLTAKQTVAIRELSDAASLFAAQGNVKAALACQSATTFAHVAMIIMFYGANFRVKNAYNALKPLTI